VVGLVGMPWVEQAGVVLGPVMAYATDFISDFYARDVSPLADRTRMC